MYMENIYNAAKRGLKSSYLCSAHCDQSHYIYKSHDYLSILEYSTIEYLCVFSLFGHEMSSKVAYFSLIEEIFSAADLQPKTSPNFKFCFIKMAHRVTYI